MDGDENDAVLAYGPYCWRVTSTDAATNVGTPGPFNRFVINATALAAPAAPALVTPATGSVWTMATLPALNWLLVSGNTYHVQIDNNSTFASPEQDAYTALNENTYPVLPLPDGVYYWRVRAISSSRIAGAFSTPRSFTLASTAPVTPILLTPAQASSINIKNPAFTWQAVTGAKTYRLQVDDNADFSSLAFEQYPIATTTYTPTLAQQATLNYGPTPYYWRVRAVNAAGEPGAWSATFQFTLTVHATPLDGASVTAVRPTFTWKAVTGATYVFQLADDPGFALADIIAEKTQTTTQYVIPSTSSPLSAGLYYWRVIVNGVQMPAWTLRVTPVLPGATTLLLPANAGVSGDNTPTFTWKAATNASTYQIQIDDVSTFISPNQTFTTVAGVLTYTADMLPNSKYFWRVRAISGDGAAGAWSIVWSVTIDALAPNAPVQTGPADNTNITNTQLTLRWNASTSATSYEVRLDTANPPQRPPFLVGNVLTYKVTALTSSAEYYWQVRARDAVGNLSAWSPVRMFRVLAGVSFVPITTPTPTADDTTVLVPTNTPAPTSTLQVVEAEADSVTRTGGWTAQDTTSASGRLYIYSSGSTDDALMLTFTGSQVDIVYVKHPSLGVFGVEVDGVQVQTVTTTATQTEFGARLSLRDFEAGTHVLRVYAVEGTIAIDAFGVETVVSSVAASATAVPTVTPTPEPTIEPTTVPVGEASVEAPLMTPTSEPPVQPTATPTVLPIVFALPIVDGFDRGLNWQPTGSWVLDLQFGYSGAAWFVGSATRGQTSILSAHYQVDLRGAIAPEVTFWQKMALTRSDVVVLDISTDAGTTWTPLDVQVGIVFDWTQRSINLTPYRGYLIQLRVQLDTQAAVPEGLTSVGYWLDDLVVSEAVPTPIPTTILPTEIPPTVTILPALVPTEVPTTTTVVATELPTEIPPTGEPPTPQVLSTS